MRAEAPADPGTGELRFRIWPNQPVCSRLHSMLQVPPPQTPNPSLRCEGLKTLALAMH